MVGPAARLAERVHVRTPEEECLDVHLLDVEFPGDDFPMHPLMAGVETAGMSAHRGQAGLCLELRTCLSIAPGIRQRDLDLALVAGFQARPRSCRGHPGGRG